MNFLQPTTLADLAQCLAQKPEEGGFLLAGCTDFLAQHNGKPWDARMLISLVNLPQLRLIQLQDGFLSIGAACTHAQTQADPLIRTHFPALAAACGNVGSQQVRNRGTVGGNIANASPAGDIYPVFLVLGARAVVLNSAGTKRILPMDELVLVSGKTSLAQNEAIVSFQLPLPGTGCLNAFVKLGEQARITIAKINLAASLELENGLVRDAWITLGAVAQRAFFSQACRVLVGQPLSRELLPSLYQALSQEIQGSIPHRASMPYKRRAVRGLADDLLTELIRQARIPV